MALRVLIAGAGIAGPAAALWLARLGHRCTVVERAPALRAAGQQVDVRRQGLDVARRMGLLDAMRQCSVAEAGTQVVDACGRRRALFPRHEPQGRGPGLTAELEIMRGDLVRLLVGATAGAADYRFGVAVDDWYDAGDEVRVRLSDGTRAAYDVLVGADGQGSRVRRALLAGPGAPADDSRDVGVHIAYFTLPRRPDDADLATIYTAPGARKLMTRWHSATRGQAYLATAAHGDEMGAALRQGVAAQKALFARVFAGAGWQAERLVAALDGADDFYAQATTQVRVGEGGWARGRVVLLGDAGYAPTPLTGMGTSLALVGAYVLAGELSRLRRGDDAAPALAAYERALRPLVAEAQRLPRGVPGLLYPRSALGVWLLDAATAATATLGLGRLAGLWPAAEHALPEYADLPGE